jgi:hypothetical protein
MTHVDEGTLQAYLDGEVAPADRTALESHLTTCGACASELEELRHASAELAAALVGADVAAGMATALQEFQRRRAALGGAPAAATDSKRVAFVLRQPRTGRRRAPATLLKAAAVVLLLAGAASAAIPGWPLNDLISAALRDDPVEEVIPPAPDPPSVPSVVQAEPAPGTGVVLRPVNGAVTVAIVRPGASARIRVRWIDEASAATVRTTESAQLSTSPGHVEIRNVAGGEILVLLPRSLSSATVEVDGRVLLRKQDGVITHDGPVIEAGDDEVVFQAR